jgi:hypothetical protein
MYTSHRGLGSKVTQCPDTACPAIGTLRGWTRFAVPPSTPPLKARTRAKASMANDTTVAPKKRRLPDPERRSLRYDLRLSQAEMDRLKALAAESGRDMSDVLRDHLGRVSVPNKELERARLQAIHRVGVNLNQIAKWINGRRGDVDLRRIELSILGLLIELRREIEK